jgi:hypothetical protein
MLLWLGNFDNVALQQPLAVGALACTKLDKSVFGAPIAHHEASSSSESPSLSERKSG